MFLAGGENDADGDESNYHGLQMRWESLQAESIPSSQPDTSSDPSQFVPDCERRRKPSTSHYLTHTLTVSASGHLTSTRRTAWCGPGCQVVCRRANPAALSRCSENQREVRYAAVLVNQQLRPEAHRAWGFDLNLSGHPEPIDHDGRESLLQYQRLVRSHRQRLQPRPRRLGAK